MHNIQILYQDKHMLVINKPSGLLSQPGSIKDSVSVRLQQDFAFVGLIHRLDMATSGIMVLALSKMALSAISKQFQNRQTFKVYEAIVFGSLPKSQGQINLPLRCDWPNRPRQEVHEDGKASSTHWQCIEQLSLQNESTKKKERCSRVRLIPHTGRSHQLRVHMMALGFPIVGDYFYAHEQALSLTPRLYLHAKTLHLNHPVTGQRLAFTCLPDF